MNILLFPRILAKTGVGNHVFQLAKELQRQGHNVLIVSSTNELEVEKHGVEFLCIPAASNNPFTMMKCIKALHKIVVEKSIDVVHCHHRKTALIMKMYNIFYRVPVIYTLHLANIPSDFLHRLFTFGGGCNIGVSSETSRFMVEKLKFSPDKVCTVLNGVSDPCGDKGPMKQCEIDELKNEWNIQADKKVFVMHSRIDPVKNHMLVVEAVKELPKDVRDKTVVVCSGLCEGNYYQQLKEKIHEYELEDSFKFVGWTDTRSIMSVADCLLLPSMNEGFPLSVVEAFMMKVLVARSETAGFYDQKYCLPISNTNPQDCANIISEVCKNGMSLYSQRIDDAYQFAMSELTVQRMVERTVEIYGKVCN